MPNQRSKSHTLPCFVQNGSNPGEREKGGGQASAIELQRRRGTCTLWRSPYSSAERSTDASQSEWQALLQISTRAAEAIVAKSSCELDPGISTTGSRGQAHRNNSALSRSTTNGAFVSFVCWNPGGIQQPTMHWSSLFAAAYSDRFRADCYCDWSVGNRNRSGVENQEALFAGHELMHFRYLSVMSSNYWQTDRIKLTLFYCAILCNYQFDSTIITFNHSIFRLDYLEANVLMCLKFAIYNHSVLHRVTDRQTSHALWHFVLPSSGSVPLMCLENAFSISEVVRPSLHEELMKGQEIQTVGARVFVAAASEAPPKQRLLRDGTIQEVSTRSCDQPITGQENETCETSLAQYWIARGWQAYANHLWSSTVRQVLIRHGSSVLSYPADQVWRLAAAVDVAEEAPKIMVNPRQLLFAEPGYILLSLDYSQIELRLMAHFSGDRRLLDILHQGGDVFKQVAAGWLRKSSSDITPEERSGAKRICYSLIYGVGSGKLATDLGISKHQANELKASFMKEYNGVAVWIKSCTQQARQQGFVETVHGRRRFLPGLGSTSAAQRSHAERQAVNTACQASAADLMKAAMIGIHNRFSTSSLWSLTFDMNCRY